MSNNNLELIKPSKKKFPELRTLKLSGNPQLIAVCTKLLRSLPNLKVRVVHMFANGIAVLTTLSSVLMRAMHP